MLDPKTLRDEERRAQYLEVLERRQLAGEYSGELYSVERYLEDDAEAREAETEAQGIRRSINELSDEVGKAFASSNKLGGEAMREKVLKLKDELKEIEQFATLRAQYAAEELRILPNWLDESVPDGKGEEDNVEVSRWGDEHKVEGKSHFEIDCGIDAEAGVRLSGGRFTVLRGHAARLHRALGQFMLDQAQDAGFEIVHVPYIVNDECMVGTGQYPKFRDDAYRLEDEQQSLIPTAEVALTNLYREQIIQLEQPIRMTALTPCFRLEAGSAGRDTRGLIRQHQFEKVELVTICRPEDAAAEHEAIVRQAENVLQRLKLPYRKVLLCSGDTGFSARKTYDIEVWMAGQRRYREISSCSDCGDFQARRMQAKYRDENTKAVPVNTLNGSGVAVGRALAAVLETYGELVPEALQRYY